MKIRDILRRLCGVLILCSLVFSCKNEDGQAFEPVQFVSDIVADTTSAAYRQLASYTCDETDAIVVFGEAVPTAVIAGELVSSDRFDNVDGKIQEDGLPDFAGEYIVPVMDFANQPYSGYFRAANENFLRENTVKCVMSALCGHCSTSAFDRNLSGIMEKAKMIVLSSSVLSVYGYDDVKWLLSYFGYETGVVSSVHSALNAAIRTVASATDSIYLADGGCIGVWAEESVVASGVYGTVMKDILSGFDKASFPEKLADRNVYCLSPEFTGDPETDVKNFIDAYSRIGNGLPLGAVIVDESVAVSVDSLNAAVALVDKVVGKDFRFVSPAESVAGDCYRWLRENNAFAHRISRPEVSAYVTIPSSEVPNEYISDGSLLDSYKFNRASSSSVETVHIVPLSDRYVSGDQGAEIGKFLPCAINELSYVH